MHPDVTVLAGLAAAAAGYGRGWRRLRRGRRPASGRRAAAFGAGLAVVAVALLPPLDALAGTLFAAHMAQHMLLVMVAAPLLVLGAPGLPLAVALTPAWRRRLARLRRHAAVASARRLLTRPAVAWGVHVAALWAWHLPGPYQAALASAPLHAAEHACFLGTAVVFWWVVLSAESRRRLAPGFAMLYLFAAALQGSALGAVLTFAPVPLYPLQTSSLADQQLAGLVMWVPADLVYLGTAGVLFMRWLASLEAASPRREEAVVPVPVSASHGAVIDGADQEGGA